MISDGLEKKAVMRAGVSSADRFTLIFAAVVMIGLYFWTAGSNRQLYKEHIYTYNHYDLLVEGFLSGHLYINHAPLPELLALSDPYDSLTNANFRVQDASLYKGKYYLYFSPVPTLLLLPWKVLTGSHMPQYWAAMVFVVAGYIATLVLLVRVKQQHFPGLAPWMLFLSVLLLGLVNWGVVLLRRVGVWEVPIASAYAFAMCSLLCLYESAGRTENVRWLAASACFYGLAIASRPVYVFGVAVLFVPLIFLWRRKGDGTFGRPRRIRQLLATFAPLGFIAFLLLVYNYLRFDNALEFGHRYQLTWSDEKHVPSFGFRYVLANLRIYFLQPAHLSPWFPFFKVSRVPSLPLGQFGVEEMYGVFPNMPVLLFALLGFVLVWKKTSDFQLRVLTVSLLVLCAILNATLMFFGGVASRYVVEVACGLAPLSIIGLWHFEMHWSTRLRQTAWLRLACGALAVYSGFFVLCASMQHKELFKKNNPDLYRKVAHFLDLPSYWYDRLFGSDYGPVELAIKFPSGKHTQVEPLIATGCGSLADALYLRYCDGQHVQMVFFHSPGGIYESAPLLIDYGKVHTLFADIGSFYPPRDSPFFDGMKPADADVLGKTLRITLDGVSLEYYPIDFHDAVSLRPEISKSEITDFLGHPVKVGLEEITETSSMFTGEVIKIVYLSRNSSRAGVAKQPTSISVDIK